MSRPVSHPRVPLLQLKKDDETHQERDNVANLMGPTVIDLVSCSRLITRRLHHARGQHLKHKSSVQLQRVILQCQGEVEDRYNVLLGPSPITTWYNRLHQA